MTDQETARQTGKQLVDACIQALPQGVCGVLAVLIPQLYDAIGTALTKAREEGRREEREACAKVADLWTAPAVMERRLAEHIASAIRARAGGGER